MNTCVYEHRCQRTPTKKSFSFPLIILKTHIRHPWIPAVPCSQSGRLFESFLFEFHVVFGAPLWRVLHRYLLGFDDSYESQIPRKSWKLKMSWSGVEGEGMNLKFRSVNGCIWISLHLLLRVFLSFYRKHSLACRRAPFSCGSEWKTMFRLHFNLRLILKSSSADISARSAWKAGEIPSEKPFCHLNNWNNRKLNI